MCKHVEDSYGRHLFASPQCLGYDFESGQVTAELCFPTSEIILRDIKNVVRRKGYKAVFVAADSDAMIQQITKALDGKV